MSVDVEWKDGQSVRLFMHWYGKTWCGEVVQIWTAGTAGMHF